MSAKGTVAQSPSGRTAADDRALAYLRAQRRRRRRTIGLIFVVAAASLIYVNRARLRHLAVPVLNAAPRPAGAPPTRIVDKALGEATLITRVRSRVTGMVRDSDGTLFVATFDQGVYRVSPGAAPVEIEPPHPINSPVRT